MKVAVLGAGGCFALNYVRHALSKGHEVIGFGRSALRGPAFTLGTEFPYRVMQVGPDNELIVAALRAFGPDWIINFCAQGEGAASFEPTHWRYFFATNAAALADLSARLVRLPGLRRFIEIGTSEIYGSVQGPVDEDAPIRPTSPYAASKVAFDLHLQAIGRAGLFPTSIIRPSNCYTPGQQLHRVIPRATLAALTGVKLPLHGGGLAQKSYLHADDLSRAVELVAQHGENGLAYNCGPERPIAIRALVDAVADACRIPWGNLSEPAPERTGQDGCYWLDSSRLRALGWAPQVELADGLGQMRDWVLEHIDELQRTPLEYRMRA